MSSKDCHIDIESFSEAPLKKCGLYRYAEDPSTEIWEVCYAFGDGAVNVWIPWGAYDWQWDEFDEDYFVGGLKQWAIDKKVELGDIYVQPHCPADLKHHAKKGGIFRAHNSNFERIMLNAHRDRAMGMHRSNGGSALSPPGPGERGQGTGITRQRPGRQTRHACTV